MMVAMKRVFISFDFDHHEELRDALVGQAKNPSSPFEIADWSVKKPFEGNWKAKVRDRMRNEDGGFVAEAPEVPGCAAHGDTQQAALEHISQSVDLWIETARELGDPIPEPRGERLMLA